MKKGIFIVIDGIDGTGKATQTEILVGKLKGAGWVVEKIDFPRYHDNFFGRILAACKEGMFGNFARVSPDAAMLLYVGDRIESKEVIEEWLAAGKIVVADRYVSANQIHQGGKIKNPTEREVFVRGIAEFEYGAKKLPKPDVVIFLNAEIETVKRNLEERGKKDQLEMDLKYLQNSRSAALAIAQIDPTWATINCDNDGKMFSREEINEMIFKVLTDRKILDFTGARRAISV